MQKITPFLWFNDQAEEAMAFYIGIFNRANIVETHYLPGASPAEKGKLKIDIASLEHAYKSV